MKAILFSARHEHPTVSGLEPVFGHSVNPVDFQGMDQEASDFLLSPVNHTHLCLEGLDLYVTGLTPALCAVIRQCLSLCIELRLWHYDRDLGDYVCQPMIAVSMEEQDPNSYGVTVPYAPPLKEVTV